MSKNFCVTGEKIASDSCCIVCCSRQVLKFATTISTFGFGLSGQFFVTCAHKVNFWKLLEQPLCTLPFLLLSQQCQGTEWLVVKLSYLWTFTRIQFFKYCLFRATLAVNKVSRLAIVDELLKAEHLNMPRTFLCKILFVFLLFFFTTAIEKLLMYIMMLQFGVY